MNNNDDIFSKFLDDFSGFRDKKPKKEDTSKELENLCVSLEILHTQYALIVDTIENNKEYKEVADKILGNEVESIEEKVEETTEYSSVLDDLLAMKKVSEPMKPVVEEISEEVEEEIVEEEIQEQSEELQFSEAEDNFVEEETVQYDEVVEQEEEVPFEDDELQEDYDGTQTEDESHDWSDEEAEEQTDDIEIEQDNQEDVVQDDEFEEEQPEGEIEDLEQEIDEEYEDVCASDTSESQEEITYEELEEEELEEEELEEEELEEEELEEEELPEDIIIPEEPVQSDPFAALASVFNSVNPDLQSKEEPKFVNTSSPSNNESNTPKKASSKLEELIEQSSTDPQPEPDTTASTKEKPNNKPVYQKATKVKNEGKTSITEKAKTKIKSGAKKTKGQVLRVQKIQPKYKKRIKISMISVLSVALVFYVVVFVVGYKGPRFMRSGYDRYIHINAEETFTMINEGDSGSYYVYFYYSNYCPPCSQLEDFIFDFAKEVDTIYFVDMAYESDRVNSPDPVVPSYIHGFAPELIKVTIEPDIDHDNPIDVFTQVRENDEDVNEINILDRVDLLEDELEAGTDTIYVFDFANGLTEFTFESNTSKEDLYNVSHTYAQNIVGSQYDYSTRCTGSLAIKNYIETGTC